MARELARLVAVLAVAELEPFQGCGRLDLPESFQEPLVELTDIITRARSGVARDGYSRELLYLPEPEAPTRLAKQLAQLAAALLALGISEAETWRLLRKTGWDSVPAVRCAVIECLARRAEAPATIAELQEEAGLPQKTIERIVEDIVSLRLAKQEGVGQVARHAEPDRPRVLGGRAFARKVRGV